jgi:hypothetical protein
MSDSITNHDARYLGDRVVQFDTDPADCDHSAGYCQHDEGERDICARCGRITTRATCGEVDDQTEVLDRLNVDIRPHPMHDPARQWRLIAADLILALDGHVDLVPVDDILAEVRKQHDALTIIPNS